MTFVALKMLTGDRVKYIGLVAGVAFAAMLITQQVAILTGLTVTTYSFITDTAQPDIWVMDPEVKFTHDFKPMTDTMLYRVRGVSGVQWAVPLYKGFLKANLGNGKQQLMIVVGVDDETLIGAPPIMKQGSISDLRRSDSVIVNARDLNNKLAMRNPDGTTRPMHIGDELAINDHTARVVGVSDLSKSFFWEPVVYTTYSRAINFAPRERKVTTYILVKTLPGEDAAEVARRIHDQTGLAARTSSEFRYMTAKYLVDETGILVNFGIAVGLGFVIGVLISGQTLYNFTLDNLRHFAALKAMGTTNGQLFRMIAAQSMTVALLGFGIGVGGACFFGAVLKDTTLSFMLPWQLLVAAALSIICICLLASLLSIYRVIKLEPAVVFK